MFPQSKDLVDFDTSKYTILIVDDDPKNLSAMFTYFTQFGFRIIGANSGETTLNRLEYIKPDIILLDILLPGIDGFETCKRIKANKKLKRIPVIFMTALTNIENKIKGFEAGGEDYITKPFQYAEVYARVFTHLRIHDLTQSLQKQNQELNQMTGNLQNANNELKKYQDYLEKLVEQRTEESNKINHELQDQINKHKKTAQALIKSEEKYRTLVTNIPIGIYRNALDPLGHFLMGNPAFIKMFGFHSETELLNTPMAELYVNRNDGQFFSEQLLSQGKVLTKEMQFKKKNGNIIWGSVTARSAKNIEDQIIYIDGIIKDITEKKMIEKELSRVTYQIHNSLKNRIESARNFLADYLHAESKNEDQLDIVTRLLSHCSDEIKNILFVINNKECSLRRLLEELELRTELILYYKDIAFQFKKEICDDQMIIKPETVQYLLSIFEELLNNVVKHSLASKVDIFICLQNSKINLSFHDNGKGFDFAAQRHKANSYGLHIIEQLSRDNNMDLAIVSKIKSGTNINLIVKI